MSLLFPTPNHPPQNRNQSKKSGINPKSPEPIQKVRNQSRSDRNQCVFVRNQSRSDRNQCVFVRNQSRSDRNQCVFVRNQSRSDRNHSFSAGTIPFASEPFERRHDLAIERNPAYRNVLLSTAQGALVFTREVISYPLLGIVPNGRNPDVPVNERSIRWSGRGVVWWTPAPLDHSSSATGEKDIPDPTRTVAGSAFRRRSSRGGHLGR